MPRLPHPQSCFFCAGGFRGSGRRPPLSAPVPLGEDPLPRRTSRRGLYPLQGASCRPPGTLSTSHNTSTRRCLLGGRVQQCCPRLADPPALSGSCLRRKNVDASPDECPGSRLRPELYPAQISVSSSLLAATMIQKSSLPEIPQTVSKALTSDNPQTFETPNLAERSSLVPR